MVIKRIIVVLIFVFVLCSFGVTRDINEALKQRITINLVDTSLKNALRIFSKQYSFNLVISDSVKGNITVQLYDVTLEDALNSILKANGYHYIIENNLILVKPYSMNVNAELNTKVYNLKFLDGFQIKPVLKPLSSTKGKIEALLSEMESEEKTQRSNVLVVTDFLENIQQIDEVIKIMDKPSKQLQIEVRLIETLVSDEKRVGIDLPKSITVEMQGAEATAPISTQGGSSEESTILSAWYELPDIVDKLSLGVLTFDKLKATLDILATDNNARLVSNPKVTTMDNKKAIIKIGTIIPIPEISRGVGGDLLSYKDKEVSMNLEVIPRIGDNGIITLNIHPVLEEIIGYTGLPEAPQPITSKREVETTVMVRDGETVVIGGLIKETENEQISKVWLLGDIPLLGYLFRHTTIKKEKKDLLIFITTKIIKQY